MTQFAENLKDVFAPFGAVSVRRMFGGHGVFFDGLMIALVADDVLYLKVDEASVGTFIDRGSAPFVYEKRGRAMTMSYYEAPASMLDDPEVAKAWAALAFAAALRAQRSRAAAKAKRKRA